MLRPRVQRRKNSQNAKESFRLTKSLHSPLHERFVELIRQARLDAKLSQIEAADQLGIRQSFISDIERGERRVDVVEFVKFCRVYDINPAAFFKKIQAKLPAKAKSY